MAPNSASPTPKRLWLVNRWLFSVGMAISTVKSVACLLGVATVAMVTVCIETVPCHFVKTTRYRAVLQMGSGWSSHTKKTSIAGRREKGKRPAEKTCGFQASYLNVQQLWERINEQALQASDICKYDEIQQHPSGWKTVRVFVSSTFADFHSEREALVKKVFPELREWCEERGMYLVECDLRWGVPQDSTSSVVIDTCLAELERCCQETCGQPFFISMLSERAGWFPADTDLDQDLSKRYKWISGMSITGMEILHGALLGLNPNAAFCLRQPDFLSMLPPAFEKDFRDADNWSIEFLQALKDQIHQKFPPQQIFKYQCTVSGLEESSGISKVQLSGLEPLCSWVLEFLKNAIQRMFPDHTETLENRKSSLPSWYRSQLHQHSLFSVQKSRLVLGRDREVADVLKYLQLGVTEHQEDMSMHESPEDPESNKPGRHSSTRIPPYLMVAPPGTGKSCLMAQCVFEAQKIPSFSLFFHFVGCCPASTELTNLVARLCCHLTPEEADQKDLLEKLKEADGISALKSILRDRLDDPVNLKRPLVICIDAFNQIYPSQDAEELLTWLQDSSFFPGNCRCVITTASLTPALTLVTTLVHEVNPLSLESARELATTYLSRYNKRLSSRQLELLLSKRSSLSPLWMTLACEELRLFGVFERVTHLIQSFPDSLEGILGSILCRLVGEDDSGLLKDFVCILHCSRDGGVLAIDVQGVLGLKRGGQAISSMEWAQLQRSVKELLRISYDWKGRDIVTFFHSSVAQAVGSCFFGRQEDKINYMCLLADYYENNCPDAATVTSELVWLLNEAGLHSRLVSFLRNDQRALSISCHTRFSYIRKLRCSWHCQPGSQTKRALLCSSCSVRTRAFGQLFLNSQSCAICGQVARMKPQEAYLCIQHSRFGPPECLVCKKIILPQPPPLPAVLCHMCGFTPRCVALNV